MSGFFIEESPIVDRQQTNAKGSSMDEAKTSTKALVQSSVTFATSIGMYFLHTTVTPELCKIISPQLKDECFVHAPFPLVRPAPTA